MADEPRYWYAARPYRWGYRRPLTWEGWLVDIALFASVVGISPYVREREHPIQSLGLVFGLLALRHLSFKRAALWWSLAGH
jgi:hypothetical protein